MKKQTGKSDIDGSALRRNPPRRDGERDILGSFLSLLNRGEAPSYSHSLELIRRIAETGDTAALTAVAEADKAFRKRPSAPTRTPKPIDDMSYGEICDLIRCDANERSKQRALEPWLPTATAAVTAKRGTTAAPKLVAVKLNLSDDTAVDPSAPVTSHSGGSPDKNRPQHSRQTVHYEKTTKSQGEAKKQQEPSPNVKQPEAGKNSKEETSPLGIPAEKLLSDDTRRAQAPAPITSHTGKTVGKSGPRHSGMTGFGEPDPQRIRKLTEEEIRIVKQVFGDEVDYSKVHIAPYQEKTYGFVTWPYEPVHKLDRNL